MASGDASQLAETPETRPAPNGWRYTKAEFLEYYGKVEGNRRWACSEQNCDENASVLASGGWSDDGASQTTELGNAGWPGDAPQPARGNAGACDWNTGPEPTAGTTIGNVAQTAVAYRPWTHFSETIRPRTTSCFSSSADDDFHSVDDSFQNAAQRRTSSHQVPVVTYRNAAQPPARSADSVAVLMREDFCRIRQEESARGRPRSLHGLARGALNRISDGATLDTVDLDNCFPWKQYVAAHKQNVAIVGPGIIRACAVFSPDTNDPNRGGAPRLDFCFYRTDGIVCRVHPGNKPKQDAALLFEDFW